MHKNLSVHLIIAGEVQGVGFRAWTKHTARSLELTGWVKNLVDGRVELLAEGDKAKIDELIDACHRGPPAAVVNAVNVKFGEYSGQYKNFEIYRS